MREKCLYSEIFWSVFSRICSVNLCIQLENIDRKNSEHGQVMKN